MPKPWFWGSPKIAKVFNCLEFILAQWAEFSVTTHDWPAYGLVIAGGGKVHNLSAPSAWERNTTPTPAFCGDSRHTRCSWPCVCVRPRIRDIHPLVSSNFTAPFDLWIWHPVICIYKYDHHLILAVNELWPCVQKQTICYWAPHSLHSHTAKPKPCIVSISTLFSTSKIIQTLQFLTRKDICPPKNTSWCFHIVLV